MDTQKLNKASQLSETAAEIMMFVAERKRNTVYTSFSGLRADLRKKYGHEVDREKFDATFKYLQDIGAGNIDQSPRGVALGFYWLVPVRQLGRLIKSSDVRSKKAKKQPPAGATVDPSGQVHDRSKRRTTIIVLSPGGEAKTYLMTEEELKELNL